MRFIKKEEEEESVKGKGLKLVYGNPNKTKEYDSHIEILKAIVVDYEIIKVFVINSEENNDLKHNNSGDDDCNRFYFKLYEDGNLIKKFTASSSIGTITSYIRKYFLASNSYNDELNREHEINERIESLLKNHKIILFMKGSKTFPRCKFSNAVIFMLNSLKIKYDTYDILEDPDIRHQLKTYSQWPTYPQLYINAELIGGHDIIKSMYDNNELKSIIPTECFE
ncbi:glutaredoxin-like protein, putative [Hepatocystis sp. ex Piliocolobus tephrosceles]|nr:glutaredoxin-like protein, putative [Hepatocystis sp. ex Piliocolobus tephrosceles]